MDKRLIKVTGMTEEITKTLEQLKECKKTGKSQLDLYAEKVSKRLKYHFHFVRRKT